MKKERLEVTVKELLQITSTGQKIRIVFLDEDDYENGHILEFENDHLDLDKYDVKRILKHLVVWMSSTTDDYLRIEVYE